MSKPKREDSLLFDVFQRELKNVLDRIFGMSRSKRIVILLLVIMLFGSIDVVIRISFVGSKIRKALRENLEMVNEDIVREKEIKEARITYGTKVSNHFEILYEDYGGSSFEAGYLGHYVKNNLWQKAELHLDNKAFLVKVKNHGRSPIEHKFGSHFSFEFKE